VQTAQFEACLQLSLTAAPSAGGSVSVFPSGGNALCPPGLFYMEGDALILTASAAPGFAFTGWSGSSQTGTDATLSITVGSAAMAITAGFKPCLLLTIGFDADGSALAWPTNSPGCDAGRFVAGAVITVAATPNSGYTFGAWSGASTSTSVTLSSFVMPSSESSAVLTPTFLRCWTLTSIGAGGSSVTMTPPKSGSCEAGSFGHHGEPAGFPLLRRVLLQQLERRGE